jgi:hypothetical protein
MSTDKINRPAGLYLSRHASDVPEPSSLTKIHRSGIVHAAVQDGSVQQINFCVSDISIYPVFTQWLQETYRYDQFAFTPYFTAMNWNENFGDSSPISQMISRKFFSNMLCKHNSALLLHKITWMSPTMTQRPPAAFQRASQAFFHLQMFDTVLPIRLKSTLPRTPNSVLQQGGFRHFYNSFFTAQPINKCPGSQPHIPMLILRVAILRERHLLQELHLHRLNNNSHQSQNFSHN